MSMVMPKRMQALKLQDELRREGIAPDLVDLDALIDSRLSYPENARNIMSRYKRTTTKAVKSKSTRLDSGVNTGFELSYAAQAHDARSELAKRIDERIRARRTHTEKQIARKPSLLDQWFKNPARSDIIGIDAFGHSKTRPIKRKAGRTKRNTSTKRKNRISRMWQ